MTPTISLVNHKGGVAKTSTAFNLGGYYAHAKALRVLLVDLDPNGTLRAAFRIRSRDIRASLADMILGKAVEPAALVHTTTIPNLFLIPSTKELTQAEKALSDREDGATLIGRLLRPLLPRFDLAIFDGPPALDQLNTNCLTAADFILIPAGSTKPEAEKLAPFIATLQEVMTDPEHAAKEWRILITKFHSRTTHAQMALEIIEAAYPSRVLHPPIPFAVCVQDSLALGIPLATYDPHSKAAAAHQAIADQLLTYFVPATEAVAHHV